MNKDDETNNKEQDKQEDQPTMGKEFLKTRTILLSGEINKPLAERVIRQVLLLEQQENEPIKVFIDSPGGDADAGFAILDMMRFVKPEIKMIGILH